MNGFEQIASWLIVGSALLSFVISFWILYHVFRRARLHLRFGMVVFMTGQLIAAFERWLPFHGPWDDALLHVGIAIVLVWVVTFHKPIFDAGESQYLRWHK